MPCSARQRLALVGLAAALLSSSAGLLAPGASAIRARAAQPAAAPADILPLDEFSPAFLGMYRKVMLIEAEIRTHTNRYGVDLDLARAVCLYESGGNASLTSSRGARGYFQVMPATFRSLKVGSNIEAGVKYLAEMIRRFGREDYAVAAYNAGPGRVARSRPMPLETLQYVFGVGHYRTVLRMHEPAIRHHAQLLKLTKVEQDEDWWAVSRRLGLPILQLRLHNPFLAGRRLRPGYLVAYPPKPRQGLLRAVEGGVEYRVRHGDNHLNVAASLDIALDSLRAANGLWHLQTVPAGMRLRIPLPADEAGFLHKVQPGQGLRDVAELVGTDPWKIIRDNGLFWNEEVVAGLVLRVRRDPTMSSALAHRVERGDTLSALARRYGTSVAAIQVLNRMQGRTRLRAGERLLIPRVNSTPAAGDPGSSIEDRPR